MSLECGIVGLPNVGKSTLFNTLTNAQVAAENFPFCTVDPNRGVVEVPDPRLDKIVEIVSPKKVVKNTVTFVDIAGLVKGASDGEGLGNQFLSHIRNVDAIVHVVRVFEDPNVIHVMGSVDPIRDIEIIDLELCLSDLEFVKKRIEKVERLAKSGNAEAKAEYDVLQKMSDALSSGISLRRIRSQLGDIDLSTFVTAKPLLYLANIAESEVKDRLDETKKRIAAIQEYAKKDSALVVPLSVALEYQLSSLQGEDRQMFFEEYGIKESGLDLLIREAYRLLGLMTFFTAGEKEARAWTIRRGQTAVDAAGRIHTDFARGFIRAEVIHYPDFVEQKGEKGAREKGLQRSEGKEYIMQDGDVVLFRFNV